MSDDQAQRTELAAERMAGRTISGLPDPIWPPAALSLLQLSASAPDALPQQRPQGPLKDLVGVRIRRPLDGDYYTDEELAAADRLTAWPVLPLEDVTFEVQSLDGISDALRDLLARALPGMDWWVPQDWSGPFLKYGIVHHSIPAPPNPATGEAMAIELYGRVESELRPRTQSWFDRMVQRLRPRDIDEGGAARFPVRVRISVATYSNLMFPGFGVPFYM